MEKQHGLRLYRFSGLSRDGDDGECLRPDMVQRRKLMLALEY
jgi:hypothetical protein